MKITNEQIIVTFNIVTIICNLVIILVHMKTVKKLNEYFLSISSSELNESFKDDLDQSNPPQGGSGVPEKKY